MREFRIRSGVMLLPRCNTTYRRWTAGTIDAPAGSPNPDGSSRLCLSCHDGTVALGDITSEPKPRRDGRAPSVWGPDAKGFLGTDLSGSHPVSFVYPDTDPGQGVSDREYGGEDR